MKKLANILLILALVGTVIVGFFKSPEFQLRHQGDVVAYRGGGLVVDYLKLKQTGCMAQSITASESGLIENTLAAVEQQIKNGVRNIHLNVQLTRDNRLVAFHDNDLSCATDGEGKVHQLTWEQIKDLDAGYGYTLDGGKTFPYRNQGLRIALLETLVTDPDVTYWLNLKTTAKRASRILLEFIDTLEPQMQQQIVHIGNAQVVDYIHSLNPQVNSITQRDLKTCLIDYALVGWSESYPNSCKNRIIIVSPAFAEYLWGWPEQFAARAQQHGSRVYLWTKHQSYQHSDNLLLHGIGLISGNAPAALSQGSL
ncbi:glycerophosphodiester phosphodiesterase family protein [Pseudoalteromonas piscicida]|uniref:glycerophosphodiester phosphodiesterase family protein n=1 Tax=Pseudoalteromonas piscicida TaxID=43662 RepID=UPI003C79D321